MIDEIILGLLQVFVGPAAGAVDEHKPEWRGCLLAATLTGAVVAGVGLVIVVIAIGR